MTAQAMGCVYSKVLSLLSADSSKFRGFRLGLARSGSVLFMRAEDEDPVLLLCISQVTERSFHLDRKEGFTALTGTGSSDAIFK